LRLDLDAAVICFVGHYPDPGDRSEDRDDPVVFIDSPLLSDRVHPSIQSAQQARTGALTLLVDQYTLAFNVDQHVRSTVNTTFDDSGMLTQTMPVKEGNPGVPT